MDCFDFDMLRARAADSLPGGVMTFCDCGADDERTVAWNERAWTELALLPRMLGSLDGLSTRCSILGAERPSPIMVGPSGRHMLFHPEGEAETARGASMAGCIYVMSTSSNVPIEAVASSGHGSRQWFQLYCGPDRRATEALVDKAVRYGFEAIVVTIDQPVAGWSPRAVRDPIVSARDRYVNVEGAPPARSAYDEETRGRARFPITADDLGWLCRLSPLPVVVKGVMRGDDARRCVELGATAIIVSNHGGRHLDSVAPTAWVLAQVVDAVGPGVEIYIDGGIRRGTDVLKALALGASAVLLGRPVLWALAGGGAALVAAMLEHLRVDLQRAMALCGVCAIPQLGRDLIAERTFQAAAAPPSRETPFAKRSKTAPIAGLLSK